MNEQNTAESVENLSQNQSVKTFDKRYFFRLLVTAGGFFLAALLVLVCLGLAQRWGWLAASVGTSSSAGASQQIYTCPMHPQVRNNGPGKCFICNMDLVPATSDSNKLDEFAVTISPAARRVANIKTAKVVKETVFQTVETIGSIAFDESRMATVAVYIDGRIEKLYADYTGVRVKKNDHLAILYSPSLYSAQVEYLQSKKSLKAMSTKTLAVIRQTQEALVVNARQKIQELGMTDAQLKEIDETGKAQARLTIYTPIGGTVIEKLIKEGQYVKTGEPIYRIADLSVVWMMLELFPEDTAYVRYGQLVEAELQSMPGQVFTGRIAYIDPLVDKKTRTVGIRVEMLNLDGRLRPGDYATARIKVPVGGKGKVYDANLAGKWISPMHPQIIRDGPGDCPICGMKLVPTSNYGYSGEPVSQPQALVVPRSAVLLAGENSVVYVETEPGRFEIRPVVLGPFTKVENVTKGTEEVAVILSGLKEGETVATSGNFLIDSQMQLAGKPSLIDPTKAIQRQLEKKKGPLEISYIHVNPVSGDTGKQLEQLYAVYFLIQKSLADDKTIQEKDATRLKKLADNLEKAKSFSEKQKQNFENIKKSAEHLHHLELEKTRGQFKSISKNIIELAATVRSDQAKATFTHFYCPMVKGGSGDWLQDNPKLVNPYFGSQMLRCGEKVDTFPVKGHLESSQKTTTEKKGQK